MAFMFSDLFSRARTAPEPVDVEQQPQRRPVRRRVRPAYLKPGMSNASGSDSGNTIELVDPRKERTAA